MREVTELLKRIRQKDRAALDELVTLVYPTAASATRT
jgi:hypothetical protein